MRGGENLVNSSNENLLQDPRSTDLDPCFPIETEPIINHSKVYEELPTGSGANREE